MVTATGGADHARFGYADLAPLPRPPDDHTMTGMLSETAKRRLLLAAEVLLILVIVGLLIATWLPTWHGATPGSSR
jgi:hypothetical protein